MKKYKRKTSSERREQRKRARMRASEITEDMVNRVIDFLLKAEPFALVTAKDILDCSSTRAVLKKQKEDVMSENYISTSIEARPTESEQRREHFRERLYIIKNEKDAELEKHFGMVEELIPRTPKELIERIKDGKFILAKNKEGQDFDEPIYHSCLLEKFIWRDPDKKQDKKGYQEAFKKLTKAAEETEDKIWDKPEDALKHLAEFQKKTFH